MTLMQTDHEEVGPGERGVKKLEHSDSGKIEKKTGARESYVGGR